MGKSAQFPLHVWLPDAMEGPTPVSALIHAATMVAAGVYLVARTYDIFVQSEQAMLVVAYIGGFTALMAATMALVKKDIKRVVAYSTVSQLGYMMMGLGIGSYTAVCSTSTTTPSSRRSCSCAPVASSTRWTPTTSSRWGACDADADHLLDHGHRRALARGYLPSERGSGRRTRSCLGLRRALLRPVRMALITVFLTAFYIFRAIFLAFTGEPRTDGARAAVGSPGIMVGPMVILAFLSVVSGWVGIRRGSDTGKGLLREFVAPSEFASETLGLEAHPFSLVLAVVSFLAALIGIGLAYALYVQRPELAGALSRRFSGLYTFLDKGWYFDALYGATFVRARCIRRLRASSTGGSSSAGSPAASGAPYPGSGNCSGGCRPAGFRTTRCSSCSAS